MIKRVLFILGLFVLLASLSAPKGYVSMKECGYDTLKYVRTNYVDNMERYVGKTMADLLDETEFEIGIFVESWTWASEKNSQIYALTFFFENAEKVWYAWDIYFKKPYKWTGRAKYAEHANPDIPFDPWDDFYYNVFKDYVIDSMVVRRSTIQFVEVEE